MAFKKLSEKSKNSKTWSKECSTKACSMTLLPVEPETLRY